MSSAKHLARDEISTFSSSGICAWNAKTFHRTCIILVSRTSSMPPRTYTSSSFRVQNMCASWTNSISGANERFAPQVATVNRAKEWISPTSENHSRKKLIALTQRTKIERSPRNAISQTTFMPNFLGTLNILLSLSYYITQNTQSPSKMLRHQELSPRTLNPNLATTRPNRSPSFLYFWCYRSQF